MKSSIFLVIAVVLTSCKSQPPEDEFVVVNPRGSIVLHTDDENEAWRLAGQLTNMDHAPTCELKYYVFKAPQNQGTRDGTFP
jgi:hypothetical protein